MDMIQILVKEGIVGFNYRHVFTIPCVGTSRILAQATICAQVPHILSTWFNKVSHKTDTEVDSKNTAFHPEAQTFTVNL